jgi:dTDP-4-dehydrorhamnose reductase
MIWIVGNKGMLGTELNRELRKTKLAFVGSDRDVDFLDPYAIESFASSNKVTAIVNCAAYTAVDKAEDELDLCARLNIEGPRNLALLAHNIGARLIHISTDYVFDGKAVTPYHEDDPVNPTGIYGRTKAEGEKALLAACPEAVVLRTAWLYGEDGNNFVYTMLRLMRRKDEIGVVADQRGSPTWAQDLARTIVAMLKDRSGKSGIYHFTDAGDISWYDFAVTIHEKGRKLGILEKDCRVVPLATGQYPTRARRPTYSVLSKEKIQRDFKVTVPAWDESLGRFMDEITLNRPALFERIS